MPMGVYGTQGHEEPGNTAWGWSLSRTAETQTRADGESLLQLQHLCQHRSILEVSGNKTLEYVRNMPDFSSHFPLSLVPVQLEASALTAWAEEVKENN